MCATDEYAIRDFKSFCRIQLSLVEIAPSNLILMIQLLILFILNIASGINRIKP